MKKAIFLALILLGCDPPFTPPDRSNQGRLETVYAGTSRFTIIRDKKTGCEFIEDQLNTNVAIAYIPTTCGEK